MTNVLNVFWKLYRPSPLFGFCTQAVDNYCREFKHYLQQVDLNKFSKYTFLFSLMEDFEQESGETAALSFVAKNENNEIVLNVIFNSVLRSSSMCKFQFIPFLLIDGSKILLDNFLIFFQRRFDCFIRPALLSARDILNLSLLQLNTNYGDKNEFSLAFFFPNQIYGTESLEIRIRADDCYKLWRSISECKDNDISRVDAFVSALEQYIGHYFKLNLQACQLFQITTPALTASKYGVLKVSDADVVKPIFKHLRLRLTDVELLASVT